MTIAPSAGSQQHAGEPRLTHATILSICAARIFLFAPFMTVAACIPLLGDAWNIGAAQAGTVVSGFYFAYSFSLFAFAWIADYVGAKRSVIASALLATVSSAAFGLFADDYLSALILYSLVGLFQGGVYTPVIMLFRENAHNERLGSAMGWLIGSTSIGYAASLALSGIGIAFGGWHAAFLLTALMPGLGMLALFIAIRHLPNTIHPRSHTSGLARQLSSNRNARLLLGGYTAHNWELLGMWTWTPALIAASFALSGMAAAAATQSSAYLTAVMHLFGALAAWSMGRLSDTLGRRNVLIWVAGASTLCSAAIGWLVALPPFALTGFVLIYAFFALGDSPVLSTALAERVDPASLGSVLATRSFIGFGAGAIAPIATGGAIDVARAAGFGAPVVWGCGFIILAGGGLLALYFALKLEGHRHLAR